MSSSRKDLMMEVPKSCQRLTDVSRWWELPAGEELTEASFKKFMGEILHLAAQWQETLGSVGGTLAARKKAGAF